MRIMFDRNCTANSDYEKLLDVRVKHITKKIGNSFSDVKWIIYDPENPPILDQLDNIKLFVNKAFNLPVFEVTCANKFGFTIYEAKEVYISSRTLDRGATILGLDDRISEHGLDFLTEVIIHELAHVEAKTADHNSNDFKSVLESYAKKCRGL